MSHAVNSHSIAPEEKNQTAKGRVRENVEAIVIAILLALFIRAFVVQAFKIPSGSMKETLQIGDHILVNKFIYGVKLPWVGTTVIPISKPEREDVVVFRFPEDPDKDFIKRTIAVAGDTVEVRNKQLYINGEAIERPYAVFKDPHVLPAVMQPRDNMGPVTVPPGKIFVMGDNRDQSYDSRFWGFVDLRAVKGEAFVIYWSWDKEHFPGGSEWFTWWRWVRWDRIGTIVK
jgi:signal peptidase I